MAWCELDAVGGSSWGVRWVGAQLSCWAGVTAAPVVVPLAFSTGSAVQ